MIKFFRIIRQSLLSENKISKYLIYALGEIVLVVIGILIALSINNINEENKLRKEYISDLKTIRENLAKDRANIIANINNGSRFAQELKQQLASKTYFTEDQNVIMRIGQPGLHFDNSGYNNAISKNTLNLIQNDSLVNLFHEYYVRGKLKFHKIRQLD